MGAVLDKIRGLDLDETFSYQTIKFVKIRDRRLGITHYVLQLAIFLYIVVYTIVIQQRYLRAEAPYGSIRTTLQQPKAWIPAEELPYCTQNSPSINAFDNSPCTYMLGLDLTYPPALIDSLFITTRIKDTIIVPPPNCTQAVPLNIACAPNITSGPRPLRYYTAGIENYTIFMEHAIFGRQNSIFITNVQYNGVMNFQNSKRTVEFKNARDGDILDVSTMLAAAGVTSLDDLSGMGASTLRYDGTLLVAVVSYFNERSNSDMFNYKYDIYHIPKVNVLSQEPSKLGANGVITQRTWYGIRVIFLVVGSIGYFDFPTLLQALVAGVVLLKTASVIVDLLILHVLPDKLIYSQHKFEVTEDFGDLRQQRKQGHPMSTEEVFSK